MTGAGNVRVGPFIGHDPARGSGQEVSKNYRIESGRVRKFPKTTGSSRGGSEGVRNLTGRVGLNRVGTDRIGSGRVGSGQAGRVESG